MGETCCNTAVSAHFSDFGLEGNLADGPATRVSVRRAAQRLKLVSQAAIAAISGLIPTMFMTRVRL
jgi:hypothetical protein